MLKVPTGEVALAAFLCAMRPGEMGKKGRVDRASSSVDLFGLKFGFIF